jgi:hypothetical protein
MENTFVIENGLPETHAESANVLTALCHAGIIFAHLEDVIQENYSEFILDPQDDED